MKGDISVIEDDSGHRIVLIPEIIFKNKQNIDWKSVEKYLQRYVGKVVQIAETEDIVYVGSDFPGEYKGSNDTKRLKGANAKAKANAVQGILEMLKNATDKKFRDNKKEKHAYRAENGWYYYTARFALPVYENEIKTNDYHVFIVRLLVKHSGNGKKYLYDVVNIKKEACTPLRTAEADKW